MSNAIAKHLVDTMQELHNYGRRVMANSTHHAKSVNEVVVPIMGAIIIYSDPATVEVATNVIWFNSRKTGTRYACSYNHKTQKVEVRRGSIQGVAVTALDNTASLFNVKEVFKNL